jgi:hypothetical protein
MKAHGIPVTFSRRSARRDRQLVEIAALTVNGDTSRAAGLALEHVTEFPQDAQWLTRVSQPRAESRECPALCVSGVI